MSGVCPVTVGLLHFVLCVCVHCVCVPVFLYACGGVCVRWCAGSAAGEMCATCVYRWLCVSRVVLYVLCVFCVFNCDTCLTVFERCV